MIDIRYLRENPDLYKENAVKKFEDPKQIDLVLKLDEEWRKLKHKEDGLRSERNKISDGERRLNRQASSV